MRKVVKLFINILSRIENLDILVKEHRSKIEEIEFKCRALEYNLDKSNDTSIDSIFPWRKIARDQRQYPDRDIRNLLP